jgi:hypothetical protein
VYLMHKSHYLLAGDGELDLGTEMRIAALVVVAARKQEETRHTHGSIGPRPRYRE